MLDRLLSMIKFSRTFVRKSKMCSGNEYKIFISYNGHWAWFTFHDNFMNKSTLRDWLYCLVLDMNAYDFNADEYELARAYGYDDIEQARKVYKACRKTSEKMHKIFNEAELDILSEIE